MAELRVAEKAMSLQVEHSNGALVMCRHYGLQLGSAPPNSHQGDPRQLIEQITGAKTAIFLAISSHLDF